MSGQAPFSFGDVVLVPFPFTDQLGSKRRPAVVVSSARYNAMRQDVVIMAITSQVREPLGFGEAMVADWQAGGLLKASVFKPLFTTIEQRLVLRRLSPLAAADSQTLRDLLGTVMG